MCDVSEDVEVWGCGCGCECGYGCGEGIMQAGVRRRGSRLSSRINHSL